MLSPYFNKSDIQYIVSFLFFYKRLNEYDKHQFDDIKLTTFMFDGERKDLLIENIKKFHMYYHFEINLVDDFINFIQNFKIEILEEIFYMLERLDTLKYGQVEFGKIYEYFDDKGIEHNFTNKSYATIMLKFFELEDNKTLLNPSVD